MIGDTKLFVAHLRERDDAHEFLTRHDEILMPFAVAAELHTGARGAANFGRESRSVADLIHQFPILWPDANMLAQFAVVADELRRAGTPIGQNDIWIAALARQHNMPLATADLDFGHVAGFQVIAWNQ